MRLPAPRHRAPAALPPAFLRCLEHVDTAQRAMLRCVPRSARVPALPPRVGIETLRLSLADAQHVMPEWRAAAPESLWSACGIALAEALASAAETLRVLEQTRELEVALTAVQDLLAPLEVFVDAERALTRASR